MLSAARRIPPSSDIGLTLTCRVFNAPIQPPAPTTVGERQYLKEEANLLETTHMGSAQVFWPLYSHATLILNIILLRLSAVERFLRGCAGVSLSGFRIKGELHSRGLLDSRGRDYAG